jgi:hypothetical protein
VIFQDGDRVIHIGSGDDGMPLIRYGFVKGVGGIDDKVPVMFDEQIDVEQVSRQQLQLVSATTVELRLEGTDLITTADLRRGLLSLWLAEADTAGLDIDCWHPMGDGVCDAPGKWCLAEIEVGGEQYVLRARTYLNTPDMVHLRAEPNT